MIAWLLILSTTSAVVVKTTTTKQIVNVIGSGYIRHNQRVYAFTWEFYLRNRDYTELINPECIRRALPHILHYRFKYHFFRIEGLKAKIQFKARNSTIKLDEDWYSEIVVLKNRTCGSSADIFPSDCLANIV